MHNMPLVTALVEFTATGTRVISDFPAQAIPTKFSLEVVGYDAAGAVLAPTSWDILLLGSLTGKVYTEKSKILEHVNTAQDNGDTVYSGANFYPARFFQIDCKALVLGGAAKIVVMVLGVK